MFTKRDYFGWKMWSAAIPYTGWHSRGTHQRWVRTTLPVSVPSPLKITAIFLCATTPGPSGALLFGKEQYPISNGEYDLQFADQKPVPAP